MTWYFVAWMSFSCPLGLGNLSWPAKAMICKSQMEYLFTSSQREADKAAEKCNDSPSIYVVIEKGRSEKK